MNYIEFCKLIGTDRISSEAEELYNKADADGELDKPVRFDLIPKYFPRIKEEVAAAAAELEKDPLAIRYMNFLRVSYFELKSSEIPFLPPVEGNLMRNFAPALSILGHTGKMEEEMLRRGIDEITAERVRTVFDRALVSHRNNHGYSAVSRDLYFWDKHFLVPDIYPIETLEFEVLKLYNEGTYYKNITTGDIVILIDVSENESAFCGYTVKPGGAPDIYRELSKQEYELCLAPGDPVISVHIPAGTKLDAESCRNTYEKALHLIHKAYPEIKFKALYCRSWLMCPELSEFLGEKSNIISFQSYYKRFPVKSSGTEVFVFVHPTPFERYEDLPENTTLERGLKKRYLENRPIYVHAGIHLLEEEK